MYSENYNPLEIDNIALKVLSYLPPQDLHQMSQLSKRFYRLANQVASEIKPFVPVARVAADAFQTVIIYQDGNMINYSNRFDESDISQFNTLMPAERFTQVYKQGGSTFLVTDKGDVYVQGINTNGQLGLPDARYEHFCKALVKNNLFNGELISRIIIDNPDFPLGFSTAFITQSGRLYCTGTNNNGKLGVGYKADLRQPTLTSLPEFECVKDVKFPSGSMIVLTESGCVYSAGESEKTLSQVAFPQEVKIQKIQVVGSSVYYFTNDDEVYAYGTNVIGHNRENYKLSKISLPNNETISQIKMLYASTFIISKSGNIFGGGNNMNGELGLPHSDYWTDWDIRKPVALCVSPGISVKRCMFHKTAVSVVTSGEKITLFTSSGVTTFPNIPGINFNDFYIDCKPIVALTDNGLILLRDRNGTDSDVKSPFIANNEKVIRIDQISDHEMLYLSTEEGKTYGLFPDEFQINLLPIPALYEKGKTVREIVAQNPALQNKSATAALLLLSRHKASNNQLKFNLTPAVNHNNSPRQ